MFIEKQINPNLKIYGTVGGQTHNTSIITVASGREQRNANLAQSRGRWDMGDRMLNKAEKDEVENHFNTCRGKLHGFRFKDWSSFKAKQSEGYAVVALVGTNLVAQMTKQYKVEGQTYRKAIKKPVIGTVKVFRNGAEVAAGFTIDYTSGLITFAANTPGIAAGVVLEWSGEYDLPVRYDADEIKMKFELMNDEGEQLFYLYSLPIIELVL